MIQIYRPAIFLALATLFATAASAGDVSYSLAYGDSNFAALNGASVGDRLSTNTVNLIPGAKGASYSVIVGITNNTSTDMYYSGGTAYVGYDSAMANRTVYGSGSTGQASADVARSAHWVNISQQFSQSGNVGVVTQVNQNGSAVGCTDGSGQPTDCRLTKLGGDQFNTESGQINGFAMRSIGLSVAFRVGLGNRFVLPAMSTIFAFSLNVQNNIDMFNRQYGPLGLGNGLSLNTFKNGTSLTNPALDNALAGPYMVPDELRYTIGAAVPEPSTLGVALVGIVALLKKRRK